MSTANNERDALIAALKFHPSASHVNPDFRDLFNKTLDQHAADLPAEQPSAALVADILKDCCECERPNHWDVETVELRVSDLTMILQRHIEGKE